tara:strand:+ start:347 stop:1405 length:1059 start_codon:yes stop_codon:yes gene_type:complete
MPSKSKAQQKFFGIVRGIQKGSSKGSKEAKKVAKSMSKDDVKDFASTKHKGLPKKVKQETKVRSLIRKMVREEIQEQMCFDLQTEKCWKGYEKKGMKKMFGKMYPNCVKKEEKIKEAITGSDRKILFILIREIVRNLKPKIKNMDVNNKSHVNRVGSSILGIIRAMTYTPDNVNYKNFKKYFPKNFNSKLVQKKLKQFHSQTDKVQVTLVTQAIKNELSEGKLSEAKEPLWDKDSVKNVIKQIQKGIKVPYADGLGLGALSRRDEHPAIMGKISVDDKKTWPNGYIENSRWALVRIEADGTIDTVRMNGYGDFKTRKKVPILRKSKNKSIKQIIDRLGKYFTVVRLKYPDNK